MSGRRCAEAMRPAIPYRLVDMHCHLSLMANASEVAEDARRRGIALLDVPVTPGGSEDARASLGTEPNVRIGVGLHPWWLADGRATAEDAARCALMAARLRYVGEVGLDFSGTRHQTASLQTEAFGLIVRACAEHPIAGRILSIHAVRAAGTALDILEQSDLTRQASCIFHWFSGTSEELARARRLGCLFSINERMLATKKGREYARILPADRLLLETDAPPALGEPYEACELEASLERTLAALAEIHETDCDELAATILATSAGLLGL